MNQPANDSVYLCLILDIFRLLLHTERVKTIELWHPIERSDPIGLPQLRLWCCGRARLLTGNRSIWYV